MGAKIVALSRYPGYESLRPLIAHLNDRVWQAEAYHLVMECLIPGALPPESAVEAKGKLCLGSGFLEARGWSHLVISTRAANSPAEMQKTKWFCAGCTCALVTWLHFLHLPIILEMFLINLLCTVSCVPAVLGFAINSRAFPPFVPPGPGDVRSPCPGLNSLANHGFIPHNGKNMTIPLLISGLKAGMNVGPDFSTAIGGAGILSSPNPTLGSFDLDNLDEHNFPIEHDASLSRQDAYFGNDYSFNQRIFDQVLKFYAGMSETSIPAASMARYARVNRSKNHDPDMVYGPREFVLSYGETALYLSIMGDPTTGIAPLEYVKILFQEERLPYQEGWRKPTQTTTLASLALIVNKLFAANPEALPEGLSLGLGALKDAFSARDPITGKLANITCAVAGLC